MTALAWTDPRHPWMRDHVVLELPALPLRSLSAKERTRAVKCDWCGLSLAHRNANAIYCSRSCQRRARYHDRTHGDAA